MVENVPNLMKNISTYIKKKKEKKNLSGLRKFSKLKSPNSKA